MGGGSGRGVSLLRRCISLENRRKMWKGHWKFEGGRYRYVTMALRYWLLVIIFLVFGLDLLSLDIGFWSKMFWLYIYFWLLVLAW